MRCCSLKDVPLVSSCEVWKDIPGFAGYYASTEGRLFGKRGLLLKPRISKGHTYYVMNRRSLLMGRIMMLTFVGPPPSDKHQAAHWDGDGTHNDLANLRWATPLENAQDRIRHGRSGKGELNASATLTSVIVKEVVADYLSGKTRKEIAESRGISIWVIKSIVQGKSWSSVTAAYKEQLEQQRLKHVKPASWLQFVHGKRPKKEKMALHL